MRAIGKNNLAFGLLGIGQLVVLLSAFCLGDDLSFEQMSLTAIGLYVLNVILLYAICHLPIVSIPNIFLAFSLLFHCGQIIKKAFDIDGTVPLPFENYVGMDIVQLSFWFYLFSQVVFSLFVGLNTKRVHRHQKNHAQENQKRDVLYYGKLLVLVGFIPRIYIDAISYVGAMANGYEGAYSLYIPQAVQSLAFFFDAGLFFLLFGWKNLKQCKWLFLAVIVYKCLMMTTGARQYKVGFLLIWIYAYYFVLYQINLRKKLLLLVAGVIGFIFLSTIGALRTSGATDLAHLVSVMLDGSNGNSLGNALGEFGAAFDTLEVAVASTPDPLNYGYGRSYIEGVLSSIPLLVRQIDFLANTTLFLEQLPQSITFAFGGSYLGELYYNFSWLGIFGSAVIAVFITKIHNEVSDEKSSLKTRCLLLICTTALILYVRGYFADMMQRLIWMYFFIFLIDQYRNRKGKYKGN